MATVPARNCSAQTFAPVTSLSEDEQMMKETGKVPRPPFPIQMEPCWITCCSDPAGITIASPRHIIFQSIIRKHFLVAARSYVIVMACLCFASTRILIPGRHASTMFGPPIHTRTHTHLNRVNYVRDRSHCRCGCVLWDGDWEEQIRDKY